jgi:hypothetical protein
MKKRNWFSVTKVLSFIMALVISLAFINPISAEAKTKTIKLKKANSYLSYVEDIEPVSTLIPKTGKYKIVQNKSNGIFHGYLKFVAPKTKTYTITLSNLKCKGKELVYGGVIISTPKNDGSDSVMSIVPKTKGGIMSFSSKQKGGSLVKKRKGTIKLTAGQVIYLEYNIIVKTKGKKLTSNLQIK